MGTRIRLEVEGKFRKCGILQAKEEGGPRSKGVLNGLMLLEGQRQRAEN